MNRPFSRLPRGLLLLVIALVAGCLYLGAAHSAVAQDNSDCEDPDTVACLPTTPPPTNDGSQAGGAQTGGSGAAPSAAAAAPAIPGTAPIPPGYCPPSPPYPGPPRPPFAEPAEPPSAAAPAPGAAALPPYPCVFDIYGTINRANLAYARAMRNLDSSQLSQYWGGGALSDLLRQIDGLWYSGTYRTLRLRSIQVVDQSFGPGTVRVHTRERWTTETWTFDGYQYDSADAWYDNYYTLSGFGGRWTITTDVVY